MWYCFLAYKYPRIGFISLLTLTVITSTGYMDVNKEDLCAPVWKRTLTSIFAISAVLIIDQLLWPVWAQKMLRKHLSDLLIATGIQFSKAAFLVSQENTQSHRYTYALTDYQLHTKILRRQHQLACQMLGLAQMEQRITKDTFPIRQRQAILWHENFDELCQLTKDGETMVDEDAITGSIEVIVEQEIMSDLVAKLMGQHVFKAATKD
ncbi:hypothetical protein CU097_002259 [Rhizopus azygosporus]|uniref:Uncharacterized protein n=1 Tax=Rhizopus azygosporus TaxID=86630 RepID=A0A367IR52_RHIAZ|nr:hypothetical protein CU097_002259 [Rhizopus azygosporus]